MKDKRAGIITLYYKNDNYGGVAQAYALQHVIKSFGYEAELISYKRKVKEVAADRATIIDKIKRNTVQGLINRYSRKIKKVVEKKAGHKWEEVLRGRSDKLEIFRQSIPHSEVYTEETIQECKDRYSIFISGSDQIWKPGVVEGAFVFSFLDKEMGKNIFSYASSVAVTCFPNQYLEFMKKELEKYSAISVREAESAAQFKELLKYDVYNVADPTLLLSDEEWMKITSKRQIQQPYIFSYLLGNDEKQRRLIKKFAKKEGKILVTIPHIQNGNRFAFRLEDWNFGDKQMKEVGIEDFFSLIQYADCVVTDSFHATVFSYIFETPFWVLKRETKDKKTEMNSRIYNLMSQMGLEDRIVNKNLSERGKNIDFKSAKQRMAPYIEASEKFLKNALEKTIDN